VTRQFALPEKLIARFRTLSFERLDRIEMAWIALTRAKGTPEQDAELHRELHTLKGEARVIGFPDVGLLCQRLEDLAAAARVCNYRVHDDLDVVVTMAIQFIGMLLRQKAGERGGGIDLEGFIKQINEVLAESRQRSSAAPPLGPLSAPQSRLNGDGGRVSRATRARLSNVATTLYLEHLRTKGPSRQRLHEAFRVIEREIGDLEASPLAHVLARHAATGAALANEQGKDVHIDVDVGEICAGIEVLEVLDTAVLHSVRNAIDHGIEAPFVRRDRGKPGTGSLRIRASQLDDAIQLTLEDDGAGVDLESVRQRARSLSLDEADLESDAALLELLFRPGFSTRESVTDLSGRGVGMDAVRSAVASVEGSVTLSTVAGRGTTTRIRVPQRRARMEVRAFPTDGIWFAVPTDWAIDHSNGPTSRKLDPRKMLQLPVTGGRPRGALTLRRDDERVTLVASGPAEIASVSRLCPTANDAPAEIVASGPREMILLHLEALLAGGPVSHG
jgi:two-component system chemotaxis sensor kinase CheA